MDSIIYGTHSILEALQAEQAIDKIFIQKNINSPVINEIAKLAKQNSIQVSYVPIEKLQKLSQENHQGVVAKTSPISVSTIEEVVENAFKKTDKPLFIILDQVSDVRNLGAIIRTAECTGVNGVIIPKQGSAAINEQTVKTSVGAIFNVPICKVDHIKDAIYFLKSYEVITIAATEKTDTSLYELDLKIPMALIMGSEGKGISSSVLKMADHKAKLPLMGEISSLNVSVACGVVLYETLRQRMFN